jgi:hypothetical protein
VGDGVERFGDRYRPSAAPERAPLSAFLTLDDRYFPSELYTRYAFAGGAHLLLMTWHERERERFLTHIAPSSGFGGAARALPRG